MRGLLNDIATVIIDLLIGWLIDMPLSVGPHDNTDSNNAVISWQLPHHCLKKEGKLKLESYTFKSSISIIFYFSKAPITVLRQQLWCKWHSCKVLWKHLVLIFITPSVSLFVFSHSNVSSNKVAIDKMSWKCSAGVFDGEGMTCHNKCKKTNPTRVWWFAHLICVISVFLIPIIQSRSQMHWINFFSSLVISSGIWTNVNVVFLQPEETFKSITDDLFW